MERDGGPGGICVVACPGRPVTVCCTAINPVHGHHGLFWGAGIARQQQELESKTDHAQYQQENSSTKARRSAAREDC